MHQPLWVHLRCRDNQANKTGVVDLMVSKGFAARPFLPAARDLQVVTVLLALIASLTPWTTKINLLLRMLQLARLRFS
jgi:hypothetical protein